MTIREVRVTLTGILFLVIPISLAAQRADTLYIYTVDTTRVHTLGEIEIGGSSQFSRRLPGVQRIPVQQIERQDPITIASIGLLVPSAHVQTNSRGETLMYIRNAGERQVSFFLDGALLNIPWDNRIDLSMVPATAIGTVSVSKGAPSVLYGANVLGGAVNFVSRSLGTTDRLTDLWVQGGSGGFRQGVVTHLQRSKQWQFLLTGGWMDRDGFLASGNSSRLRYQDETRLRTNTDQTLWNGMGRLQYTASNGSQFALSLLHYDGSKGIAPEGQVRDSSSVRFWRYPDVRNTSMIVSAEIPIQNGWNFRGSAWYNRFFQQIDDFGSPSYSVISVSERGEDDTIGSRFTAQRTDEKNVFRFAVNLLSSSHDQAEGLFSGPGNDSVETDTYEQQVYSVGAEWSRLISEPIEVTVGASWDTVRMPETGDKPQIDPFSDYSLRGIAAYRLSAPWRIEVRSGRKTRFPTMRELFGVALNRFVLNPDLKPESSSVLEVAAVTEGSRFSGEVALFYQRTYDTIDQHSVRIDGVSKRQRINLPGSRVAGLEVAGTASLSDWITADGHITVMDLHGLDPDGSGEKVPLAEKPNAMGTLSIVLNRAQGWLFQSQVQYTGKAYSFDDTDAAVRLAPSLQLNLRLAYRRFLAASFLEYFIRTNNVFDAEVLPQLGLPAAGREIFTGVKFSF